MTGSDEGTSVWSQRAKLLSLVALLCVLPALLIVVGHAIEIDVVYDYDQILPSPAGMSTEAWIFLLSRRTVAYSVLEWTIVLFALGAMVLSFGHFYAKNDGESAIIGIAAFWMAAITAVHLFAFHGFFFEVVDQAGFLYSNWFVAQSFVGLVLVTTAGWVLFRGEQRGVFDWSAIVVVALGLATAAALVIFWTAGQSAQIGVVRADAIVVRPLQLVPLAIFALGAGYVFPRLHGLTRSVFSLSLWASSIPFVASQLYITFGSFEAFDAGFTAAQLMRVLAFGVIVGGLSWDYVLVCQRELRLEKRLARQNRRIRMLVDNAVEAIAIFDSSGCIVDWNYCAESLFQWGRDEAIGSDLVQVLFSEGKSQGQRRELEGRIAALIEGRRRISGVDQFFEAVFPRRDGSPIDVEYSLATTEDNAPVYAILIRDISRRKKLQLQMLQMDRLVSIGTLAAGVVHEIKNPLTYVATNLELAREIACDMETEATADEQRASRRNELSLTVDDALVGVDKIRRIIDDVKVFAHDGTREKSPISVRRALEVALRMTRGAVRKVARLETQLEDVQPVLAEETRLTQVFVNLVSNAVQAMSEVPSKHHLLRVALEQRDDTVVIRIADTGPGMTEEVASQIFRPFFTTKDPENGTGLGLSLSRSIVDSVGGEIDVTSTPGEGTVFEVRLPILDDLDGSAIGSAR